MGGTGDGSDWGWDGLGMRVTGDERDWRWEGLGTLPRFCLNLTQVLLCID